MFRFLTLIAFGFGILVSFASFGQESANVPLGALPMQYNPSFAGQVGSPRVSSNFRYWLSDDFTNRSRNYEGITSYDQFIPAIRGGIGFTASYWNSKYNSGSSGNPDYYFNSTASGASLTMAIAPKLSLKGKYTLSPSLDFTYGMGDIAQSTNMVPFASFEKNGKTYSISSRVGVLFNTNKLYVGYSVYLMNRSLRKSVIQVQDGPFSYDFRSYLQTGYTFQRSTESKFSFTPQLVFRLTKTTYESKVRFGLESFNLNFRYKQIIWGVNNQGLHIGWQTDRIRLMLTNNYGLHTGGSSGRDGFKYAANLSFRYMLGSKDAGSRKEW
jgi:hypothetical protein